jgi:hypothetical protein
MPFIKEIVVRPGRVPIKIIVALPWIQVGIIHLAALDVIPRLIGLLLRMPIHHNRLMRKILLNLALLLLLLYMTLYFKRRLDEIHRQNNQVMSVFRKTLVFRSAFIDVGFVT